MKFDKATQEKLQRDLVEAGAAAVKALDEAKAKGPDGGACNFDSAVMYFPRVQETKVEACAAAVGFRLSKYSNGAYHLSVPHVGHQGHYRTVQAEAQCELLRAAGWDVHMYYKMD